MVEVTVDTPGAADVLESQRSRIPAGALPGAGTITNVARAEAALAAGAAFLVTPNFNVDVIKTARTHGTPGMPGAMTPTEIWNAAETGADFVKVFPAAPLSRSGPGPRPCRLGKGNGQCTNSNSLN